jgi:AcrR family transcriptional regulator
VATGSFYTYFADKQAAFAAVLAEVREEMSTPRVSEARSGEDDPVAAIEAANRAYLEVYRSNARLMALMEQVAAIDEEFRRWRLESSTAVARRNARGIRRLQERGLADSELDADVAAAALGVMVSRMAHLVFTQGHRVSFDTLLAQVTRLWANALGIPTSKGER